MIWAWLLNSVAVFATAKILPGVEIKNFWSAIVVAALLAIVNTFLTPILQFIALPVSILTLGLFALVINTLMIMLVDALVEGFKIKNFWWALVFGIVMSLVSGILFRVF
ncbi:MAG: phage holin family protein [Balneola sp.]|jgi:putative membrane protein|uniref:phage holin family protein n=1 Tax=Balneola sp. EhC07 TaxID=1849360 RepID=UPI0007F5429E|nr:phage holin family protein [Balneola sp. EhC07]MBO6623125.1 phage holin family protein [Balneola sp.]MBO6649999.1 phage holin family protein [Balneola sp.]MBO6711651.1 phage holin family protein [Balneola sp.]MBO6799847.1 phage holin family protein [Balneola sp.]MBO6871090.1 phage holin family protein [Balneola sp.]